MDKVAILSLFRDNEGIYIDDYLARIKSLTYKEIMVYLVEGDSKDNTLAQLDSIANASANKERFRVVKHDTGRPKYGSVVNLDRFLALGETANAALERIVRDSWADGVLVIDSDLLYPPNIIERLLSTKKDIVAPKIMAGKAFYDIWGFRRLDGNHFSSNRNDITESKPFEIYSAGGVVMFPLEAIKQGARYTDEAIVSLCRECAKLGYSIWCDPSISVYHPLPSAPNDYTYHLSKFGA